MLSGNETVTPTKCLIGPVFALVLVTCSPGGDADRLRDRFTYVLMVLAVSALVFQLVRWVGQLLPINNRKMGLAISGPLEEGFKVLGALLLAWLTSWAKDRPARLVLLGAVVGVGFCGLENLYVLDSYTPRNLWLRFFSFADHAAYTGLAISGIVLARYLRSPFRYLLPVVSFCAGVGAHIFHNRCINIIHGQLLIHVDPLPTVMTREQWESSPSWAELWILLSGGFTFVCLGLLTLVVFRIHHLARNREARP